MSREILIGGSLEVLKHMDDDSVACCVTSPPYWGVKDYGVSGQIGIEKDPADYVRALVAVFRETRRVLSENGTLWLNIGDKHASRKIGAIKPKDLIGLPWMVAFALRDDGWYLRHNSIWHKPNPRPECCRDRPTTAHEFIFLLSRSPRYYYDHVAILEPHTGDALKAVQIGDKPVGDVNPARGDGVPDKWRPHYHKGHSQYWSKGGKLLLDPRGKNKRTVWKVRTKPRIGTHCATYPEELIEPCILAGCPEGRTVLDPFAGVGTTGTVAHRLGRKFIGIDIKEWS